MEKKIIFTPVEPNRNLLWLHYREDQLVLEKFGSNGWESIGETDYVTEEEFIEALKNKADLVGGKVPAEELPSYVDDIIEFNNIQVADAEISSIIGNKLYKNQIRFVNNSTTLTDRIGSEGKYPNMFVNFGENTSEDDWTTFEPEQGKIYVNTTNNHSYRWSGSQLIDLDQSWSQGIKDLQENTIRTDTSQDFSTERENQALSNIGLDFVVVDYSLFGTVLSDEVFEKVSQSNGIIISDGTDIYRNSTVLLSGRSSSSNKVFVCFSDSYSIVYVNLDLTTKRLNAPTSKSMLDGSVQYGSVQSLTDVQKQQARSNIGVQSAGELLEDADFIAQLKTKLETV